jgi:esterase/lipase superfamily enzyme
VPAHRLAAASRDSSRPRTPRGNHYVFYATNRQPTGNSEPSKFYGTADTRELAYGRTSVSIPSAHKIGELELASLWRLELNPNANRHFVLKSVVPLGIAEAKQQIAAGLRIASAKSVLIFVHGYNVTFSEAALRTAQLAHDLRFPGIAMVYSWPSAGQSSGYLHDEESAQLAKSQFDTCSAKCHS